MTSREPAVEIIAVTAACCLDPSIAIAAARAGHVGVVDLEFAGAGHGPGQRALEELRARTRGRRGRHGVKLSASDPVLSDPEGAERLAGLDLIILAFPGQDDLRRHVGFLKARGKAGLRVLVEVVNIEEASRAEAAGADALIAKGQEAGGRVGTETAFILLQRLAARTRLPVFVQGGIGVHTAAAAYVAGAAGIVLDEQLALTRESPLPATLKAAIARMDGSETVCLGEGLGQAYRILSGPAYPAAAQLAEVARTLRRSDDAPAAAEHWRQAVRAAVDTARPGASIWLVGQAGAFAAPLARRHRTVHGVIEAVVRAISASVGSAKALRPLAPEAPLAKSLGIRFPILQGPMTRVSDRAAFAARVAEEGALPFLALALMRGVEVEKLLGETQAALGGRPWGVGILGFVPSDRREEQLAVVRKVRPDFALIAGARPDQALALQEAGIPTFVHVPSPALLKLFIESGARRFVFEGRECGGHVGPRSSFVLWDQMVDVLLEAVTPQTAPEYHVVFAGGIHDALSGAMVAAIAAPLAARGCKLGVLIGTAYTATREAVATGAILEEFQKVVLACDRTVLLESGTGHVTRCAESPYVARFEEERRRLVESGEAPERVRDALEELNVGRLRIATKGVRRGAGHGGDGDEREFVRTDTAEQRAEGLYMLGQVAALCDGVKSMAELHGDLSEGGTARLEALAEPPRTRSVAAATQKPAQIAIVGMACILPKAPDLRTYWANILDKVDAIAEIPEDRWDWRRYYDPDPSAPDKIYSKWGGFIADVTFDPLRYGIPPNSIPSVEPLHLLTLETVRSALEDAGFGEGRIPDEDLRRRTSVILGVGGGTGALGQRYAVRSSLPALIGAPPRELLDVLPEWTEDAFPGVLANVTAGRVANRFDLGGVNFTVDAACGASLAAVTVAVRELEAGTSDMAIVGGADAFQNPFDFLAFSKTHALSPRGRCCTFDASADGIAISEGVAILVLRRLEDAEREGARIYGVIQGAAGSSDGRDKSLTAPRPQGQALALNRAYAAAGFSPATVGLVEAHGTGTVAGDRAEVETLKTVFGAAGAERQSCGIGSVKSMIGHTKATAGAAGLIKVALALHHKTLPPTLHVERPNPEADFPSSPFYILREPRPWVAPSAAPRRAGVSAFGFGGTNFHLALEEYADGVARADREAVRDSLPAELLLWSAPSRADLLRQVEQTAGVLAAQSELPLRDLAYTLWSQFRREQPARLALVAGSSEQVSRSIDAIRKALADGARQAERAHEIVSILDPRGVYFSEAALEPGARVAFVFPGQGSQYPDMLRDLALHFEEVRDAFGQADAVLAERVPHRLSAYVFPPTAFSDEEVRAQQAALTQTDVAQPAIGAASVGVLRLLRAFGLVPEMAAGHSYGEYVALHCAGVFDAETLFRLSHTRGRQIVEAAQGDLGTMASVAAGADAVTRALDGLADVQVANRNAPDQTVIAGPREAIQRAVERLNEAGLATKAVPVACGFHSACMAPARDRLADALGRAEWRTSALPVYSNVTALPYPDGRAEMHAVLAEHLMSPVRFMDQIKAMYDAGARVFVEAGPGKVLTGLIGRILADRPHLALACDAAGKPGVVQLGQLLAQAAVAGLPVDLERLFEGRRVRRLDLSALLAGGPAQRLPPTTWLVNGATSRPLGAPKRPAYAPAAVEVRGVAPSVTASLPETVRSAPTGSDPPRQPARSPQTAQSGAAPVAAGRLAPGGPAAGAPHVMLQYQDLMARFLETQQQVMLAYLRKGSGAQTGAARIAQADPAAAAVGVSAAAEVAAALPSRPVQAVAPAPGPGAPADRGRVTEVLVGLVSERTGYPQDMLDLELDLEADLGIDSIKRVEILGQFRRQFIPESTEDVRQAMEGLMRVKSLRAIIDGFLALLAARSASGAAAEPGSRESGTGAPLKPATRDIGPRQSASEAPRFVMVSVPAPPARATFFPVPGALYLITEDQQGVAERLRHRLTQAGARVVLIHLGPPAERPRDGTVAVDLTDADAVRAFRDALLEPGQLLEGLFHCLPLQPQARFQDLSLELWRDAIRRDVKTLFNLAMVFGRDLRRGQAPRLIAATQLAGASAADVTPPASNAGVSGLVRTLAKEWPEVACRVVEVGRAASEVVANQLLAEAGAGDSEVEVAYHDAQRMFRRAEHRPLRSGAVLQAVLNESSVVLVTGGARGITAEITDELAARYRPVLVLCGSSPLPAAQEGQETAGIAQPRAVKAALIALAKRRGETVTTAAVETRYRQLLKEREIRATLGQLGSRGARVEYRQVDVRDAPAFGALIDSVYRDHGRLDGVIHGAGIIEDKLIEDKTADSFDRVVETKTLSAFTLARKLRADTLRFLVFFTSVAGRFGNRGQSDYAAANEILSRLAAQLDADWPGRVVAISWGPWNKTGMVSEEIKRQFAELGIQPVDAELGRRAFDQELRFGRKGEAELVWGSGPWGGDSTPVPSARDPQAPARAETRPGAAARPEVAAASGR